MGIFDYIMIVVILGWLALMVCLIALRHQLKRLAQAEIWICTEGQWRRTGEDVTVIDMEVDSIETMREKLVKVGCVTSGRVKCQTHQQP